MVPPLNVNTWSVAAYADKLDALGRVTDDVRIRVLPDEHHSHSTAIERAWWLEWSRGSRARMECGGVGLVVGHPEGWTTCDGRSVLISFWAEELRPYLEGWWDLLPGVMADILFRGGRMNTTQRQNPPEHFELLEGYACFKPVGALSLPEAVTLISQAIAYAYDHQIPRLLVNTTGLTGIYQPTIMQRYEATREWASQARGCVKAALLTRPGVLDRENLGDSVAFNAGLRGKGFTSEAKAMAWLLDDKTG